MVISFVFFSLVSSSVYCQASFYVATTGKDSNPGTIDAPCQTLEAARKLAKAASGGTAYIYLRGGVYYLSNSFDVSLLTWDPAKSLHISNYNNEQVTLSGGLPLDRSKISLVTNPAVLKQLPAKAASQVYVTDLKAQQVTDFGQLHQYGYGHVPVASAAELFIGDQALTLARSPNSGNIPIGIVSSAGSVGDGTTTGAVFHYNYAPAAAWSGTDTKNLWVSGIFNNGWSDETVSVASISPNTIRLGSGTIYGVASSIQSSSNNERDKLAIRGFYFFNLLEALDTVGEYYIDRTNALLYFWPPSGTQSWGITLSMLSVPLMTITNVSNVTVNGIKFAYTRGCAIQATNASHITITHATFCDLGQSAVATTANCTYIVVDQSLLFNIGSTAINLIAGNRTTLTSGNNVVKNSEFYGDGRLFHSFNPPISLDGVGAVVSNCYIHDMGGQAILYQGNNHMIVNNIISHVCTQFDDVGAVATGRDPSSTGTLITNNFFEGITCPPALLVSAVYIDDGSGGIKVHSNLFLNCGTGGTDSTYGRGAVHINGGVDNECLNNIFVNVRMAFSGTKWDAATWSTYLTSAYIKQVTTQTVNILSPVYQQHYPFLNNFFNPNRNHTNILNNSIALGARAFIVPNLNAVSAVYADNTLQAQTIKTWAAILSYFTTSGVPPTARAWLSWTPINFGQIGIQPD